MHNSTRLDQKLCHIWHNLCQMWRMLNMLMTDTGCGLGWAAGWLLGCSEGAALDTAPVGLPLMPPARSSASELAAALLPSIVSPLLLAPCSLAPRAALHAALCSIQCATWHSRLRVQSRVAHVSRGRLKPGYIQAAHVCRG